MSGVSEGLLEPWGPFEMGGFEGCTDQNPDYCACATDVQPTCRICDREIEPGESTWSRQWPCYDTLPLGHPDQEWDVISWHDDCDAAQTPRNGPSGDERAVPRVTTPETGAAEPGERDA